MPTLIGICGEGRSGSTMLDLMLGNGEQNFSCGEIRSWFRPWRENHDRLVCGCGDLECKVWADLKDVPEQQFHKHACEILGLDFIVDSSKEPRWVLDSRHWAQQQYMDVHNILIWKSGEELAHSYWKRGRDPYYWRDNFVQYHRALLDVDLPLISVPFRELVENPEESLAHLCALIGMPFFEGKEKFWESRAHQAYGSAGARKQRQSGTSRIQVQTGFAPGFEKLLPDLRARIAADTDLQAVYLALEERRFDCLESAPSEVFRRPFPMPGWYYIRWAKEIWRKRFPQKWTPPPIRS